jgi:hypothetical protein
MISFLKIFIYFKTIIQFKFFIKSIKFDENYMHVKRQMKIYKFLLLIIFFKNKALDSTL